MVTVPFRTKGPSESDGPCLSSVLFPDGMQLVPHGVPHDPEDRRRQKELPGMFGRNSGRMHRKLRESEQPQAHQENADGAHHPLDLHRQPARDAEMSNVFVGLDRPHGVLKQYLEHRSLLRKP